MAEELEEKKPKVELIKKQKVEEREPSPPAPAPQSAPASRKKLIVVRRKNAGEPAAAAPVRTGRVQPKVVVSARNPRNDTPISEKPAVEAPASDAAATEATAAVVTAKKPQTSPAANMPQTEIPAAAPKAAAAKVPSAGTAPSRPKSEHGGHKAPESHQQKSHKPDNRAGSGHTSGSTADTAISDNPLVPRHVISYTGTARPQAAAGRVGGRFVGPRNGSQQGRGTGQHNGSHPAGGYHGGGSRNYGNYGSNYTQGGYSSGAWSSQGGYTNTHPRSGGSGYGQRRPGGGYGGAGIRTGGGHPVGGRPTGAGRPIGGYNRTGYSGGPGYRPGMRGGPGRGPAGGAGVRPGFAAPAPAAGRGRKTGKGRKSYGHSREEEMEEKLLQTKKKLVNTTNPVPKQIEIMEVVTVSELARKMNLKASDLIAKLMSMGQMVTINQQIDADTASILASEYNCDVKIVSLYDETVIDTGNDEGAALDPRPPVVTVMGHVDHGKTKLLDAIRSTDVVDSEFGGITQHIGAYIVDTPKGRITFLDTPGHEAFTMMRARGAQVTDIVVLVVAADDGVMPQTIEAINHAKDANVPIIVAINKIDKPEANPDRVKTQLSELGLTPEDWGGDTMFVEISALKKIGIDDLLDSILLEAEMLDLKANYNCKAEGKIIEARVDPGRGIVATVMIERGALNVGDPFVAGVWAGRVRALYNDKGTRIEQATPSMPVEVQGFEGGPNAGEPFQVVEDEKYAREVSAKRQELKRFEDAKNLRKVTLEHLRETIASGEMQELKIIIKADLQGSAEALKQSLEKLSTKEIRCKVIQALPGAINEGDVELAVASKAVIIGFNVRPVPKAKALADQEKVDVRKYNVIYKAVEEVQQAMEGMLKPETKEETIATVEVRQVFKVPKVGNIAGSYVLTGTVKRSASVHVIRDSIVIFSGPIASLRHLKDDVKEVQAGFECGIGIEGFDDVREGDQLEVFEMVEIARKLSDTVDANPADGKDKEKQETKEEKPKE
jgi:translation initiation factor IF-2